MGDFYEQVLYALEAGRPVVLASVLTASGSTPRGTGAMLAVFSDGSIAGSIGGSSVEYEAQQLAARRLEGRGEDEIRAFSFRQGDREPGGEVTVHFQLLTPDKPENADVFQDLAAASGRGEDAWLVRKLAGGAVTRMLCAGKDADVAPELLAARPVFRPDGWLSVPVSRPGRVYLFGGGHVSQELSAVIARVGFRPVVWDDRPGFAVLERFPQAVETLCRPYREIAAVLRLTRDDFVAVMTSSPQTDFEVLAQVLRSEARYVGCIGSRRKLAACRERLLSAGFSPEECARLHAPIGLSIGAETPEEIAVSVAAELIAVRAGAAP